MDTNKLARVRALLLRGHLDWQNRQGRPTNQVEFCLYLGVPPTSYSQWIRMIRPPAGDNVHRIAAKLGPEIYDVLGLPRRMPTDPALRYVAEHWHTLDADAINQIHSIIAGDTVNETVGQMA